MIGIARKFKITPQRLPVGCYVYALVDPVDDRVFYIGKGTRARALNHFRINRSGHSTNPRKDQVLTALAVAGVKPVAYCIEDGLSSDAALRLERQLIMAHRDTLTNASRGSATEAERGLAMIEITRSRLKSYDQLREEGRTDLSVYFEILGTLAVLKDQLEREIADPIYRADAEARRSAARARMAA